MNFDVKVSGFEEVRSILGYLPMAIARTAAAVLNRAATHGRAIAAKAIRKEYTMKSSDIKDEMKIEKANARYLKATIRFRGRTIPLIQFKYKGGQRRKKGTMPVQVMVKKSRGYRTLRGAFVSSSYGGALFVRRGKGRYPRRLLKGPSVAGMVKDVGIMGEVKKSILFYFDREFKRSLRHSLGKGRIGNLTLGEAEALSDWMGSEGGE